MNTRIGSVVIPTYGSFLQTLVERSDKFTTMIWPGHRAHANRMVGPSRWLMPGSDKSNKERQSVQAAVPFLFRNIDAINSAPPYHVSYVGLAIYMVHDDAYCSSERIQNTLSPLRVEKNSGNPAGDEDVRTWYVMTETTAIADLPLGEASISYERLHLFSQEANLSANFTRGYAKVELPETLQKWYAECLAKHADLLALPNAERWQAFVQR